MPPDTTSLSLGAESPQIQQQFSASGVAQVIVVLKAAPAAPGAAAGIVSNPVRELAGHFVTSELSQDSAIRSALGRRAAAVGRRGAAQAPTEPHVRIYPNLGVILGQVTPDGLNALRKENSVATVTGTPHLALIKPRKRADAKPPKKIGWGINALEVPRLWKEGLNGKDVIVAHLDTGADGKHPALKGAFANFAEFDMLGNEVTPSPAPRDTDEHGTHTGATVAGRAVSGFSMGVAPGSKLASAIVIEGGNVVARVLAGLNWAVGNKAKVLSMSLGLTGWWDDFLPIIRILRVRGVLPVIAVGNEGPGTSRSPGNYSESLSVGAMQQDDTVADFSSSQKFKRAKDPIVPDVVGPGVDIISAVPGRRFKTMSGTSMATPHIAGLAALLFQAKPGATVDEVEEAIFQSANLAPGMTAERAGRGFPNAPGAFTILTGTPLSTTAAGSGAARPRKLTPRTAHGVAPRRKKEMAKEASAGR